MSRNGECQSQQPRCPCLLVSLPLLAFDPRINPIFPPARICRLSPEQCHNREFLRMFFFYYITKRTVVLRIGILFLRESWQTALTNKPPLLWSSSLEEEKKPPWLSSHRHILPFSLSISISLSLHFPLHLHLHLPLLTNTHSLITSSRSKASRVITNIRHRLYATRALILQKHRSRQQKQKKK